MVFLAVGVVTGLICLLVGFLFGFASALELPPVDRPRPVPPPSGRARV